MKIGLNGRILQREMGPISLDKIRLLRASIVLMKLTHLQPKFSMFSWQLHLQVTAFDEVGHLESFLLS